MNTVYPDSASFLITEDCNLACKYCFEKHNKGFMSKEIIRKGLEMLCYGSKKSGRNNFHAMIFGGEPMLRLDLVEEILSYGLELSKKERVRFTAGIVTNSTIFNKDVERLIKQYGNSAELNIQLSIDGDRQSQDEDRRTKSGKSSFDLVAKAVPEYMRVFKEMGRENSLNIHGCISKKNLPRLYNNYRFFLDEWGFKNIWFMPIHEDSWELSDVEIYEEQLNKIADFILYKTRINRDFSYVKSYSPIDRCLRQKQFTSAPCGAGKSFITITADGRIYSCHHLYFIDNSLVIGDVWTGIDDARRRIFLDYDYRDIDCRKDCDHTNCYRCIAVNYGVNGSILSQVKGNYCKLSYVEKGIQDKVREELEKMGIFKESSNKPRMSTSPYLKKGAKFESSWVEGNTYYERYANEDGSYTILDGPVPDEAVFSQGQIKNKKSASKVCGCGEGSSEEFEILGAALKSVIEVLTRLEENQIKILKALNLEKDA